MLEAAALRAQSTAPCTQAIFEFSIRAHWEDMQTQWFVYVDDDTYTLTTTTALHPLPLHHTTTTLHPLPLHHITPPSPAPHCHHTTTATTPHPVPGTCCTRRCSTYSRATTRAPRTTSAGPYRRAYSLCRPTHYGGLFTMGARTVP